MPLPQGKRRRVDHGSLRATAEAGPAVETKVAAKPRGSGSELPITAAKARLLSEIKQHPTVVLVGDTGSGKTTQLPQFLYNARFCSRSTIIGCTQPRRVAAVSVAQRVAKEMKCEVGGLVG